MPGPNHPPRGGFQKPKNVGKTVRRLLGYLTRSADTEDRRVIHLSVTPEGAPIARQAQQIQNDCGQALLEGLTAEQKHQLETLWEILLDNGERLAGEVGR